MSLMDLFFEKKEVRTPIPKKDLVEGSWTTRVPTPTYSIASLQEYHEYFANLLQEENVKSFPGNDFYEFLLIKNSMGAIASEEQRYQIAFTGLAAAGLTRDKLLSTAKGYISIIDGELTSFDAQCEQTHRDSVVKLEEDIKSKNEEIDRLSKQLGALSTEVATLKAQSMENSHKLSERKSGFVTAGNSKKQELQMEIEKINQFIK